MVVGALAGGLDFTSSRRLNLAAAPQRTPLVVLSGAAAAGTSAAAARWRIAAAPAARDRFGALAAPRWHVALERCRLGNRYGRRMNRPGVWLIEWDHVAHRFRVVAGLANRPPAAGAGLLRAG
jgi:protein ImuA